jgi:small multidrug resistance family-3 protein
MTIARTIFIFIVAAALELGGAYAIWRWRRVDGPGWLVVAGAGALFLYAIVQTFQPESSFGRLYAAYAAVFLVGAMVWGWLIDGTAPDRADVIGAAIVLFGASVVLWGRDLVA